MSQTVVSTPRWKNPPNRKKLTTLKSDKFKKIALPFSGKARPYSLLSAATAVGFPAPQEAMDRFPFGSLSTISSNVRLGHSPDKSGAATSTHQSTIQSQQDEAISQVNWNLDRGERQNTNTLAKEVSINATREGVESPTQEDKEKDTRFFTFQAQLTFGLEPNPSVNVTDLFEQWIQTSSKLLPDFSLLPYANEKGNQVFTSEQAPDDNLAFYQDYHNHPVLQHGNLTGMVQFHCSVSWSKIKTIKGIIFNGLMGTKYISTK